MESVIRKNLAKIIRDSRNERGWSQKELAEKIGVSQSGIAKTELRKNRVPFDMIVQIAYVLDIPWEDFHPWKLLEKADPEEAFTRYQESADELIEKTTISSGEKIRHRQRLVELSITLSGKDDRVIVLSGGDTVGDVWEYIEEIEEILDSK